MTSRHAQSSTIHCKDSSYISQLACKLGDLTEQVEVATRLREEKASDIAVHLKGTRSTSNAEYPQCVGGN